MTTEPARLRPSVVVAREVRGLTGEQMVAAHALVELHTLRSSGIMVAFRGVGVGPAERLAAADRFGGVLYGRHEEAS